MQYKKIGFTDVDGVLRGKYVNLSKLEHSNQIEHCDVVFGWDLNDRCYDKDSVTGWNKGFGDALLTLDPTTERTIPWESGTNFMLGDYHADETFKHVCPRSLLKSILTEYKAMGITPKVGFEYEWFNFDKTAQTIAQPQEHTITQGMFGYSLSKLTELKDFSHQLLKDLQAFQIDVEGFHTETGPGVYEAALKYTHALEAADQAALFKLGVKEIALHHNIIASFMAKWNAGLPGCGGHIHVSLVDQNDKELLHYAENEPFNGISENFLSGILEGSIPLFPLYAPIVNSYKRFIEGSWAATSLCWGFQNRTTAVRIIPAKVGKCHVEMRIPGADVNPYLAIYALLASGLYGIREKLQLKLKEQKGSAYVSTQNAPLPKSLEEAVRIMQDHSLPKKILDPVFVDHYLMTRQAEVKRYQEAVTDWEINRYLEII